MPAPGGLSGAPRRLLLLHRALDGAGLHGVIASSSDSLLMQEADRMGLDNKPLKTLDQLSGKVKKFRQRPFLLKLMLFPAMVQHSFEVLRAIADTSADVIWVRGSKGFALIFFAFLLSKKKLIWDVDYELPSKGFVRLIHTVALHFSSIVVFQYQSAPNAIFGQSLSQKYRVKFHTIIPGIDANKFSSSKSRPNNEGLKLTMVGSIGQRKNQNFMVEVMSRLSDLDHITLDIYGDVDSAIYKSEIDKLIRDKKLEKNISFKGWKQDIREVLSDADILVMPSKDEGVPNAAQEAMCMGVPVIASRCGGLPEIINHDQTGWVFDLDDVDGWVQCIEEAYKNRSRCRSVGISASDYALANFGLQAWGRAYCEAIRSVQ